jgi:thiamine-phosphate pyrophosphorylase
LGLLQIAAAELALPVVAIGGITEDNAAGLIAAGADAVAVVSALFDAFDVEAQARRFARMFQVPVNS